MGILLVNFGAADVGGNLLVDPSTHTGLALDSRNPGDAEEEPGVRLTNRRVHPMACAGNGESAPATQTGPC